MPVKGYRKPTRDKDCVVCGVRLVRKDYEWANQFERRQACGQKCGGILAARNSPPGSRMGKKKPNPEIRHCAVCGKEIGYRPGTSPADYLRRVACGRSCSAKLSRGGNKGGQTLRNAWMAAQPHRTCPICGDVLVRREDERAHDFKDRVTCGKADCANKVRSLSYRKHRERISKYPMGWQRLRGRWIAAGCCDNDGTRRYP